MTVISERIMPLLRQQISTITNWSKKWKFENTTSFFHVYWLRSLIVSCLSPIFLIIPAFAFKLAYGQYTLFGYVFSFILLIPWLLIPTLFIQHNTSYSKIGKIISFLFIGVLILAYVFWIKLINI